MTEGANISVTLAGDISKPVTALVERFCDAVGVLYAPTRIVRDANAKAEASRIELISQLENADLERRAELRIKREEQMFQQNIESILGDAIRFLKDDARPQDVTRDWHLDFSAKCRFSSDEFMRQMWARLLAEEYNQPGSFCKKTVSLMSDLEASDAKEFADLCRFVIQSGVPYAMILDEENDIFVSNEYKSSTMSHLDSLSLVNRLLE